MNGTRIFKGKEEWVDRKQGMYYLFSAAIEAAQGTELGEMNNGRRTENKIQNSKYHQLSLPLLSPVLDSAQRETWGRQGWNKDFWRSTVHPPPALPQTWQKEKEGRDENVQSVKYATQWNRSSAESPNLRRCQWDYPNWVSEKYLQGFGFLRFWGFWNIYTFLKYCLAPSVLYLTEFHISRFGIRNAWPVWYIPYKW